MKKRIGFLWIASLVSALMLMVSSTSGAEVGITKDTITVGSSLTFTSPANTSGRPTRAGIMSYLNVINEQGGIYGRKIKFIAEDDVYDPAKTVAATKKLVEVDQVFALLASSGARTTLAVLPYIVDKGVPLICPYSPVTELEVPFKRNIFTTTPCVYEQYYFIADYAIKLGAKRIAQFSMAGSPEGAKSVIDRLAESGMTLLTDEEFKIMEKDFSAMVLRAKSKDPDFCIMGTISAPGALLSKEAQKQGLKPSLGFMSHSTIVDPEYIRLAGSAAEGVMALEIMKPVESNDPEVVEFRTRLTKYFPEEEIGFFAMYGYASAKIFCEGMKKAGENPTRAKLIEALESMTGVDVGFLGGPLSFSPTQHQGTRFCRVCKVKNGKWEPITGWLRFPGKVK